MAGSQALAWEPAWLQSSALLNSRQSVGDIPIAKLELGVQVRSQAGAWERDEINAKASSFHLTLTADPWQLITAHRLRLPALGSLPKPLVGDGVVVPGELGLGGQGHLYLVVFGQALEQPGAVFFKNLHHLGMGRKVKLVAGEFPGLGG